jgi:hypothetical protein
VKVLSNLIFSNGYTMLHVIGWCIETGNATEEANMWNTVSDIPAPLRARMIRARDGFLRGLKMAASK